MQKALETAYDDWNKSKTKDSYFDDDYVVESKHAQTTNSEIDSDQNIKIPVSDDIADEQKPTLPSLAMLDMNDDECVVSKSKPVVAPIIVPPTPTASIAYYFGNPSIDLIRGIIHIYKDT
jgi:hypothetical protein